MKKGGEAMEKIKSILSMLICFTVVGVMANGLIEALDHAQDSQSFLGSFIMALPYLLLGFFTLVCLPHMFSTKANEEKRES